MKRFGDRARRLRISLWTLIVPPTLWAVHFLFCYLVAAMMCADGAIDLSRSGYVIGVGVVTLVSLAIVIAAGMIAYAQERIADDPAPHDRPTQEARLRFIAKSTLLLSGLSAVAILFTAMPVLFLTDCR